MIHRTMKPGQTMRLTLPGQHSGGWLLTPDGLATIEVSGDGRSAKISALAAGELHVHASGYDATVEIGAGLAPIEDVKPDELEAEHPQG